MFSSTQRQAASSAFSLFLSVRCLTLSLSQFWLEHNLFWPFFKATHMPALGLPGWLSGKEPTRQSRRHRRRGTNPWGRRIPWRRKWQPTPVFSPGKFHGQRSSAGYSPGGRKDSDMTERLSTQAHPPMIQPFNSLLFKRQKWKLICPQLDLNKNGYGSIIKLRGLSVSRTDNRMWCSPNR